MICDWHVIKHLRANIVLIPPYIHMPPEYTYIFTNFPKT